MIHLCHGFNVRDRGGRTFAQIIPLFKSAGILVNVLSYPWTSLLTLRTNNRWAVGELCERVQKGDGFIGHSNGAWIGVQAAELMAPIEWMILVNPALHPNHEIPHHVKRIYVLHSHGDSVVRAGGVWRRIANIFPWRWKAPLKWGAMGAVGYTGNDDRVTNIPISESLGHSGAWQDKAILEMIVMLAKDLSDVGQ